MKFKRGDFVTYTTGHGTFTVRAIVRTVHKDGTYTVEARHIMRQPRVGYLGYRYRLKASDLRGAE